MDIFSLVLSTIVIITIGCLSHFIYGFSHQNKIVGLFVAVNESIWEHIKIAVIPTIIWCIYDVFFFGANPNYFIAKFISIAFLIVAIPLLFYSYNIISKKAILMIDIIIFCVCIFLSQTLFYFILTLSPISSMINVLSIFGIFAALAACIIFTIFPLELPLFQDPLTKKYGYDGYKKHHHDHQHKNLPKI